MSQRYFKLIISFLGVVILVIFITLGNAYSGHKQLKQANDLVYLESLSLITSGLNVNYNELDDESKIYYFTRVIEGLSSANTIYELTNYYHDNAQLDLALNELKLYITKQWLTNFETYKQTQMDVYNLIINISMYPNESQPVNDLFDFLNKYNF